MSFDPRASSSSGEKSIDFVEFPKTFGWIGLGAMGLPMALQLVKNAPLETVLHIYDVDLAAMDRFVEVTLKIEEGTSKIVKAACAREVAEKSQCVITIVPEGGQSDLIAEPALTPVYLHAIFAGSHVKSVYLTKDTGILAAEDISGKIFIDCSTIDIETSQLINQSILSAHKNPEILPPTFFDAPVSGGTAGAAAGTLSIMIGTSQTSPFLPLLTTILCAAGGRTIHVMGAPTLGLAGKLSNNYLSGMIALATSEAMNLGMRLGIEPSVLQKCFSTSSGGSWVNDTVNPVPGVCPHAVTSRGYEGGFKVQLMKKDMSLAIGAAKQVGANLVLADAGLSAYSAAADDPRCRDRDSRVIYRWLGGFEPDVAPTGQAQGATKEE